MLALEEEGRGSVGHQGPVVQRQRMWSRLRVPITLSPNVRANGLGRDHFSSSWAGGLESFLLIEYDFVLFRQYLAFGYGCFGDARDSEVH